MLRDWEDQFVQMSLDFLTQAQAAYNFDGGKAGRRIVRPAGMVLFHFSFNTWPHITPQLLFQQARR